MRKIKREYRILPQALGLRILGNIAKAHFICDENGRHEKHTIFDGKTGRNRRVEALIFGSNNDLESDFKNSMTVERQKTIFAQFDNSELKKVLENIAEEFGLVIYWGRIGSPDVITVPATILVVDPSSFSEDNWFVFTECRKTDPNVPCMVVSFLNKVEMPVGNAHRFNMNVPDYLQKFEGKLRKLIIKNMSGKPGE